MPKIPKLVSGAVLTMVAVAALLMFTRGDSPRADATTLASLPGTSGTDGPTVNENPKSSGSTSTLDEPEDKSDKPKAQAQAQAKATDEPTVAGGTSTPTQAPTTTPPSTTPPTTEAPPPPSPTPDPPRSGLGGLLDVLLGN